MIKVQHVTSREKLRNGKKKRVVGEQKVKKGKYAKVAKHKKNTLW